MSSSPVVRWASRVHSFHDDAGLQKHRVSKDLELRRSNVHGSMGSQGIHAVD